MAPQQEPEYTQTCPDVEMPELNGAIQNAQTGLLGFEMAYEDARAVVETLNNLGIDTTQTIDTVMGIVTVYLYSGQFASLKNYAYFAEVIKYIANEYSFDFADLSRSVLNVVQNYAVGEIDSIAVPAQIQQLPIRNQYKACLDAISYPSVKLVEVPFFTHTGRMVDSPPLPPGS